MFRRLPTFFLVSVLLGAAHAEPIVRLVSSRTPPAPMSQRAEVAVDGRTSWLEGRLDLSKSRRPDPGALFSGDFVGDSSGFSWYLSRHYALKSDLGDGFASEALTLLELAWPQLRALFGAEPPDPGKRRMTLVLASDRNALKRAAADDGMHAFTLGGVTQEGYACSYLYAGTPYQTRYIALHEATHLFQYCLNGNTRGWHSFFVEGVADFFSSHVYDPGARRLTVNVLDRAPIHNHLANGLAEWHGRGKPSLTALLDDPSPPRGLSVLLAAFLQSTPDLATAWRGLCHDIAVSRLGRADATDDFSTLLAEHFGNDAPSRLGRPFASWLEAIAPSYRLVSREFDQEGDAFVSLPPASAETPAVLEIPSATATGGAFFRDWPHDAESHSPTGVLCRMAFSWDAPPAPGSCAVWQIGTAGAAPAVSCTISNALSGGLAFFEINGLRDERLGNRRLPSWLADGVAVELRRADHGGKDAVEAVLLAAGAERARLALDLPGGRGGELAGLPQRLSATAPGIRFLPVAGHAEPSAPLPAGMRFPGAPPQQPLPTRRPAALGEPIDAWQVLGPFSLPGGAFGKPPAPQPASPVDPGELHTLDDGTFVSWRPAELNHGPFAHAPVANLTRTFVRQANHSFAYALAEVESDAERDAVLSLGVSDGVEVWHDGRPVADDVRIREWVDGSVRLPLRLHCGRNEILLRLTHGEGVWLLSGAVLK